MSTVEEDGRVSRSTPPERHAGAGPARRSPRFASLDVSRGLILVVQVCVISVLAPVPDQLRHPTWFGVTLFDLVFPVFVTLSGVGLAFAYGRRTDVLVTTRRVVVLCLAGLLYTALLSGHYDPWTLRLTGVLQLYGVLVLVSALLHTVVRTARGWAVVTVVATLASAAFMVWWQSRCSLGVLTPECNPSGVIDGAVFGSRMYAGGERGHDPEGLVSIFGAFITASAGTTAGHIAIRTRRGSVRRGLVQLGAWTVACAGLGAGLSLLIEPFKRLWTPSFALLTASLGLALFTLTLAVVDGWLAQRAVPDRHPLARPLIALGRNSLLVYFGSHFLASLLRQGDPSLAERLAGSVSWLGGPRVGYLLLSLAFWWGLTIVLHRYRIYVRA